MIMRRGIGAVPTTGYGDIQSFLDAWAASVGLAPCRSGTYTGCPNPSLFATEMNNAEQAWFASRPAPGNVTTSSGAQNAPGGNPSVSFQPSRSGVLQPGDTWVISIKGGSPNSPVVVSFSGSNPSAGQTATIGTTDASGNFSLSGSVLTSQVGTYTEAWTVGGTPAGNFSFSVALPTAPSPPSGGGAPPPSGGTGGGAPPPGGGGATVTTSWFTQSMIDSIPNWALLAAAVVAFMFMGSGKGRR